MHATQNFELSHKNQNIVGTAGKLLIIYAVQTKLTGQDMQPENHLRNSPLGNTRRVLRQVCIFSQSQNLQVTFIICIVETTVYNAWKMERETYISLNGMNASFRFTFTQLFWYISLLKINQLVITFSLVKCVQTDCKSMYTNDDVKSNEN